ncbi:arsenate reductase family protein [Treponema vincentii]|nr:arsenate reductase family protein [Treponema vincentii]
MSYPYYHSLVKVKKWLDNHHIDYTERHIKEDNPSAAELKTWHQQSGLPLKKFFNTSGLLYKSLQLKDKLPGMTDDEMYAILASDGMLVKRPLIITKDKILIGFKEKEWEENLL